MHAKTSKLSPPELPGIKRKSWLKLLGVTFQEDATNWDIDNMLSKASSRMYILKVCGYSKVQLNNSFNSLVMSVFLYGIEVWGAAYQRKHLDRIDRFLKRAHRFGFVTILDLIEDRDSKMIIYFMICYFQRRNVCFANVSMILYFRGLELNASSRVSEIHFLLNCVNSLYVRDFKMLLL